MKRLLIIALCGASLSGCSTFSNMDKGLDGLVGQPAQAAFDKIGMPTSEQTVAGRKAYVWGRSFSMSMPVPQTTNYQGTVGTTAYSGSASSTAWQSSNYECTIRIFVDQQETITGSDYDGNIGGCEGYSSRLKPRP